MQSILSFLLISNTKIRIFKFRDGFFIRKVRAVNARTGTSNLAQPGLHGVDFLFRALHLTCNSAFVGILHPANHSYFLSLTFCVHSEADTLHSPEHLVVHGFEGPRGGHGGEPAAEEQEREERGSGRGDCEQEGAHGAARRTPRRVTRRTAANEAAGGSGRRDAGRTGGSGRREAGGTDRSPGAAARPRPLCWARAARPPRVCR